ncbi:uncharacterized protein LOC121416535 [Lytechinus variegatus]|uniref:uncharacterized protein LOC121416535 n=1 Tax=Lytechinus variegatus TaxID=7654 RepID=UPI001BB19DBE|nr:uncharacterized protein LOC121416535 [Lytechinus variegatus]
MKTAVYQTILITLCLGGVFVVAADNEPVHCLEEWFTLHADIGKCLYYSNYQRSWYSARWYCAHGHTYLPGTRLFYPADDLEFNVTRQLMIDNDDSKAWLGVCKISNGNFVTSDGQDYTNIWTGTYGLTDSENPAGFLEMRSWSPAFRYRYQYWRTRRYICGRDACRIDCDRLCALIEAFEDLL